VLSAFFQFVGQRHPTELVPGDVLSWRDRLRWQKKSAATAAFKLFVIRSSGATAVVERKHSQGLQDFTAFPEGEVRNLCKIAGYVERSETSRVPTSYVARQPRLAIG
jgi:hypothetical protein